MKINTVLVLVFLAAVAQAQSLQSPKAAANKAQPLLLQSKPAPLPKFSDPGVPPGWQKVSMQWNYYPGWETNGISFNVREYTVNDRKQDFMSCCVKTNVKALSVVMYSHPMLWRGITATNLYSGTESNGGIAPVSQVILEDGR